MNYTKDQAVEFIRKAYREIGRAFSSYDYKIIAKEYNWPSIDKLYYDTGLSWHELIELANIPKILPGHGSYKKLSIEEALLYIKKVYDLLGELPTINEYNYYAYKLKQPYKGRLT